MTETYICLLVLCLVGLFLFGWFVYALCKVASDADDKFGE